MTFDVELQRVGRRVEQIAALPRRSPQRLALFFELHERLAAARVSPQFRAWQQRFRDAEACSQEQGVLFDQRIGIDCANEVGSLFFAAAYSATEVLHAEIAADSTGFAGEKRIVYLGDYIDRGPDSRGVVDRLVGNVPDGFPRERAWDQIAEFLRQAAPIAERHNVVLAIEPLNRKESNILNTGGEALRMVTQVSPPNAIAFMIDYYHLRVENEDLDIFEKAGRKITHLHFANPAGRRWPERADEDRRRVPRVDDNFRNLRGAVQTAMLPSAAAVARDPHTVTIGDVVARICFAGADPHDFLIAGRYRNRTDRRHGLLIEYGLPRCTRILRLPNPSARRAGIKKCGIRVAPGNRAQA